MAARKSFLLFLANIFGSGLGFIATYVVAHRMGAEALGTIGYVMGLTGITAFISNVGFSQAHFRYAAGQKDIGDLVSTYGVIITILTLIQILALATMPWATRWLGNAWLNTQEEWILYVTFSIGLLLTSGTRLFSVTHQAQEAAAKVSLALALGSLTVAIAQIGVAVAGLGVVALGIAYQVEPAVKLLVLWLTSKGMPYGRPRRSIVVRYTRYTAPIALRSMLNGIYGNVDKIQLQQLGGTQQVGFYTGNLGTAAAINRISMATMRIFFPRTVADVEQGQLTSARRRLNTVLRYLLLLVIPMIAIVAAYSHLIVRLTLGPDFLPSASTLSVLAIQAVVQMIAMPYTNMILALEKHAYLIPASLLSVGILVLGNTFLIPTEIFGLPAAGLGSTGAAMALTLAAVGSLAMQMGVTARFAKIGFPISLLWFAIGGGVMFAILRIPSLGGGDVTLLQIPPLITIGIVAFVGLMLLTHQLSTSELRLFVQAINPVHMIRYVHAELNSSTEESNSHTPVA
ncbi:MAG: oligosaccharide flippase family protein [Anaerolineae bacterium]